MKYKCLYSILAFGIILLFLPSCKKDKLDQERQLIEKSVPQLPMKIIGHRGSSYTAPENTLASARLAWTENADIVECDVWLSKDKKVIVSHDETTDRCTNANYSIPKTNSSVLRTLDAGSWKSSQYAGEKLPFLEELIETVPAGKRLFIELKSGKDMDAEELVPYVKEIINNSGKKSQMTIISLELDAVKEAKKQMPDVPAVLVTVNAFVNIPYLFYQVEKYNIDGLDTHRLTTYGWFISECKKRDIPCYTWTCDDAEEAQWFMDHGLSGITTNRPGYIREALSK